VITDYASLQVEAAKDAQRRDLDSVMPGLIQRAEANIFRELALYGLTAEATGTSVGGQITAPNDMDGIESLAIDAHGWSRSLDYIPTQDGLQQIGGGVPRWYGIDGSVISMYPTPAENYDYTLRYTPALVPLSDASPTNWVLLNAPDVYLHATVIQIGIRTQDDALITRHGQFYNNSIQALRNKDARQRLVRRGGLQIRPRNAF
jgi:hypothetical protein